jgi:hypothetical protein
MLVWSLTVADGSDSGRPRAAAASAPSDRTIVEAGPGWDDR